MEGYELHLYHGVCLHKRLDCMRVPMCRKRRKGGELFKGYRWKMVQVDGSMDNNYHVGRAAYELDQSNRFIIRSVL